MAKVDEIDEIWDDLRLFKQSRMWHTLLGYMQGLYAEAAEAALQATEMKDVILAKGIAHAVKCISQFDDNIPELKRIKEAHKDEPV